MFLSPVMVASSVENMWLYARKSHVKPHLTEALWLGCGSAGMKVSFSSSCHSAVVVSIWYTCCIRICTEEIHVL